MRLDENDIKETPEEENEEQFYSRKRRKIVRKGIEDREDVESASYTATIGDVDVRIEYTNSISKDILLLDGDHYKNVGIFAPNYLSYGYNQFQKEVIEMCFDQIQTHRRAATEGRITMYTVLHFHSKNLTSIIRWFQDNGDILKYAISQGPREEFVCKIRDYIKVIEDLIGISKNTGQNLEEYDKMLADVYLLQNLLKTFNLELFPDNIHEYTHEELLDKVAIPVYVDLCNCSDKLIKLDYYKDDDKEQAWKEEILDNFIANNHGYVEELIDWSCDNFTKISDRNINIMKKSDAKNVLDSIEAFLYQIDKVYKSNIFFRENYPTLFLNSNSLLKQLKRKYYNAKRNGK